MDILQSYRKFDEAVIILNSAMYSILREKNPNLEYVKNWITNAKNLINEAELLLSELEPAAGEKEPEPGSEQVKEDYAMPHTCPQCSWQCTCSDQPCSCCPPIEPE